MAVGRCSVDLPGIDAGGKEYPEQAGLGQPRTAGKDLQRDAALHRQNVQASPALRTGLLDAGEHPRLGL
jgi:hypothetical protein